MDNLPFNLDRFLESGNAELFNFQTRMLVNDSRSGSFKNMSASDAKDAALDNLFNKISLYGLQEYFDESLMIFCSSFDWRMPFYTSINRKNTRNLIQFDKYQIERIADMNAIDLEVYKSAKEKFLHVLGTAAFDKPKLKRFRLINRPASFMLKTYDWVNNRIRH